MKHNFSILCLVLLSCLSATAEPTVTDVVAKQRYPWNGMVDVICRVSGISGTVNNLEFTVAAVNSGNVHDISQFWVVKDGINSADHAVHTNGIYHIVWDSKTDFDNQICSNMVVRVNLTGLHDKVQLWANGPYWATTNIGAENPEDYGYYFWWGDTVGYKRENDKWVASDGSSSYFLFRESNTPTYNKSIATLKSQGWITADSILAPEHDAAHIHWGGDWRMPTKDEFGALNSNCDWTWTTQNGVNGYVVRGRGDYADNSIFLPCAGGGNGTSLYDAGSHGCYFSSVPYSHPGDAWCLYFISSDHRTSNSYRYRGRSVRPVQGFTGQGNPTYTEDDSSGDSAPFVLDTREELAIESSIVLPYDAAWIGGNSGATVVITDNGTEVKRTTGAGEFTHTLTGDGRHELTYSTYIGGVPQNEVYTVTVFKGWAYEVDDDGDAILVDTAYKSGDVVIPAEIDGHTVVGIGERAFEGCEALTSVTIPDSVWNIGEGAFAGCSSLRRVDAAIGLKRLLDSDGMFADCSQDLEVVYHQTAEISDVMARQRYPWNGKVDIAYTLTGDVTVGLAPDTGIVISVTASNPVDGATSTAEASALSGDTGSAEGEHHIVWDLNAQGLEIKSDEVVFSVVYATAEYCAIDLSGGANAVPVAIDSRLGENPVLETIVLPWNAEWIGGDSGATVIIEDNGTIVTNTTGAGEFTHTLTGDGRHDLTYTTYIGAVAQDEVYKAVVYKGKYIVHFDSNGGEGAMDDCEFVIDMPSALPQGAFTKDGHFLLGWALTPDGEATLLDGDSAADIVAEEGETVTLYAVWYEGESGSYYNPTIVSFYVDAERGSDSADGRTWTTARKTIQSAIDSADDGDTILVADGIYEPIVCTNKTLSISSMNGAISTTIDANGEVQRCADLTDGVSLVGFTLQNGRFSVYSWDGGGGARKGVLWNCIIRNNSGRDGGGVQDSELHSCLLYGNSALNGGGGGGAPMYNCTIVGNSAAHNGGGVTGGKYYNCIICNNTSGASYSQNTAEMYWTSEFYSCLIGLDASFVDADNHDYRLAATSPCIDSGDNSYAMGETDLARSTRIANNKIDIGCYEYGSYTPIYACAVHFDANGGEGAVPKRVYAIRDDVALPEGGTFTRDGWILVGWATEADGPAIYPAEGSIDGGVETANRRTVTLYARWAQDQYTVHFDANGGDGEMVDESFWLGIPDWLSSNVFTRVGYIFAGWATVADGEVEYGDRALVTNLTETADATANLYAVWSPNQYQVRFNANGGEGGWSEKMDYGTMIVAPEVSRIGYTFKGWDKDVAATVPDEDITYTAQWEVNAYAVTFDGNGGEGGTSCEQDYNSPIVAPSVSRIGYTFAGWSPEVAETVPASNVTYTAQWEINKYTVTFDAKGGEGGTSCEQDYNSPIVAPSVSLIGHTFAGWLPEVAEIVPASNVTYAAQWEVNQYSVTFDANGGVGGLSAMQDYNSDIVPPVVSRFGCTFEGWAPSPDAKVPANDVSYFAQWKVWDITVDSAASSVKELYPDDYFRITNIVIGAEVDCLPAGFFEGCDALEYLTFLSPDTELGDNDLRTVGRLYETQPDGYWIVQGVLFGYKGDCPREIPELDSVKRVVDCALDGCKALEELNFTAESVLTTIGTNAFKHCTELQRMTLPPSLEEIGNEAFMSCSYLGNVIVPSGVKHVGDRAFKNCTGFTAAQIAYGVESLGEEAFYGDWRISEVDIPSTVTNIGVNAFGGDSSIIRVGLRGDVRPAREIFSNYRSIREATVKEGDGEIVDGLFSGFSSLHDVHFLGNCPALANDGQLLYMNTPDKTVDYGGGNVINALVTYVEQNSTGWDGTPGSHSLPQAWPLTGSYRRSIAWWDSPTYLCQFDSNGGTLGVQDTYQYSEKTISLPPEPVQTGYTFAGWWTQPVGGLRVTADTIFIEGVYTRLYAHWIKGHWVFLDPNGGTVVNDFVTYVEESVYGVLPVPVRSGYSFGGWLYNGYKIEPETEINEKADHTLVAQWTANLYSVRYNANGGDGGMAEQGFVYGVEQELRKNLFARSGYEFIGWATNAVDAVGLEEETDAVVYADCESVTNLTAVADGWIELFAVWKESDVLPDPSNLDFHFSGDAKWELRYEGVAVEKDGETLRYATVWRSGSIANNQKSVLVANVYGAGKIGFWWKVSCESFRDWKLDNLEFAIDGVAQVPWINGEKDWAYVEFEVETSGAHTLTWAYSKDEEGSDGEDCGWITAAVWTPKLESLGDYVNCPTLEFSSSGNSKWQGDKAISHDGIASLRSGAIGDGEVSTLETEVEGAGRIGFWWKVSSEAYRTFKIDYVSFSIDDVEQAWMGGEIGWTNVAFDVVGSGTHTLRWEYRKDDWEDTKSGEDCAWLDEVVWTPKNDDVAYVTVPDEKAEVVASDGRYVVAAKGDEVLTEGDFTFAVVSKEAYKIEIAPDGKSATVTLAAPEIAVATEQEADDGDPSGLLADVDEGAISAKPEPEAGETLGALPVKTYEGLYYQASWGDDLGDMTTGEKVQATGEKLYLGVIKQTGDKGFYKISVSEE